MTTQIKLSGTIPETSAGLRLDQALARLFPEYSRARLQQWIESQAVTVNGNFRRAKDKVSAGDHVNIQAAITTETTWQAEALPLDIIYADDAILIINKPAGVVVHPGAGNSHNTLVNALLHYDANLQQIPRAGIVHRLDKDTSGLLVVARTLQAHHHLVKQLQQRSMQRHYCALVNGTMVAGGTIDQPIARHPHHRTRMAVHEAGKPAITEYRVRERFTHHTLLALKLHTGRTHQIRVHLAHIHYPIVGDPVYGGRLRLPADISTTCRQALTQFKRQALHAEQLQLLHPNTQTVLQFNSPLPVDLQQLLTLLREKST